MNNPARHLLAVAFALAPLTATQAALNTAIVPADARWFVSIDLNAVRESAIGKEIIAMVESQARVSAPENIDLKPDMQKLLATIGTATAYGTNFSKNAKELDGALVLQGTADLRKIAEAFVAQATVTNPDDIVTLKDLPFEAYTIHGEISVGFPPEPIVLLSRSTAQLARARDIFRTGAGSMAKAASQLGALVPKSDNFYLVAACVVPNGEGMLPTGGPQARILQMAEMASIAIGEGGGKTSAQVQLVASSDEMGEKLVKILNGVSAMLSLTETSDKQLAEFLQSVKVTQNAKTVTLTLAYPTEGIVRMVHSVEAMHNPAPRPSRNDNRRQQPENNGKVLAEWVADQQIGQPTPTAEALVTRTIENVALKNGAIITLAGRREDGENARLDCVDIAPAGGGAPLHFEAENMKLARYSLEKLPFASGGRDIMLSADTGTARFEFPGVDGTYTIEVHYVDESDGKSTFSVSAKDPAPPAGPE